MDHQAQYNKPTIMEVRSNVKLVSDQGSTTRRVVVCYYEVALRLVAVLVTLTAAIVTGVDKETANVSISLTPGLAPLQIPVTAKWQYLSAFVYFVAANAIACTYTIASLIVTTIAMKQNAAALAITVLDTIMLGFLLSANGAAAAVGLIAHNGNSHTQWNKVCYMVEGFCHQLIAAIVLSLAGCVVFLWLVVLAVVSLHRKSR